MSIVTRAAGTAFTIALAFVIVLAPGSSKGDPAEEEKPAAAPKAEATPESEAAAEPEAARPSAKADETPLGEDIVVTATRSPRPLRDLPADVTVVNREEIERSPGKTVDELLRSVPVFNSFRRSSSVGADPSSAGVSLRGVGPSAAARSLLLVDGVPANDSFGDNIWWRAVPPLGIQRIEVVPGGGSALYGNYALAGVTQVLSRPITPLTVDGVVDYGSFNTARLGGWGSDRWGPVGAAVEADLFRSDGYLVVAPYMRGPIDKPASSEHAVGSARLEAKAARDLVLTARGGFFYENFNGGTEFTTAAVRRWELAAGARYTPSEAGTFDLSLSGHARDFMQDRARVTTGRTQEFLTARQFVPAYDLGTGLLWRSQPLSLAGTHDVVLGVDARWITGEARETRYPAAPVASTVVQQNAGGRQELYGFFAEDVYDISEAVEATFALRFDFWDNLGASLFQRTFGGTSTTTPYSYRSDSQVDPKVGLRVRPVEWLTLRAAAYHSFRAPTLDELYRSFQVGTVTTLGNPDLGPETLWGGEIGFGVTVPRGITLGVTGFWNVLKNPVVNVTCPPPPGLPVPGVPGATCSAPTRLKQNLGQARIRGIEASAEWRFARFWSAGAAYAFADSRVTDAPGNPQLVGMELPQDPRIRGTLSLSFDDPNLLTIHAEGNYIGAQFENDANTLPMGEVYLLDLVAAWHATKFLDVYLALQNLLDRTYLVGRAGVDTVGQPRFIHGGVRGTFGG